MKSIVIFGEFSSDNLGDVLLGESQLYVYKKNEMDIVLSTFAREADRQEVVNKNNVSRFSIIKKMHRKLYRKYYLYRHILEGVLFLLKKGERINGFRSRLLDSKMVIIGGGQLFSDNSLRMLLNIYCITKVTNELGIEIKIVGSGIPTPKTFLSKYLMKRIFSYYNKENVFLRDTKSQLVANKVSKLRLDEGNILPDFAISYISHLAKDYPPGNSKTIGLAPISSDCLSSLQRTYSYNSNNWWISLAKHIKQNGLTPVLFCHGTVTDFERCLQIQREAKDLGVKVDVMPRPTRIEEYLSMLSLYNNVLAQRLHVSITAFSLGKSPVSLPWDEKVRCFYESAGLINHFLEEEVITNEKVFKLLLDKLDLSSQRNNLVNKTSEIITNLAQENESE